MLDAQDSSLRDCVMKHAIANGKSSAEVAVHVVINSSGQVFACEVKPKVSDGSKCEELKDCAVEVMRAAHWPKGKQPLVTVERTWSYKVK